MIDPLYIHRLYRLSDYLEVDEDELVQVDDDESVFYWNGQKFRVLSENELLSELLTRATANTQEAETIHVWVEYLYLPSARQKILSMLNIESDTSIADTLLMTLSKKEQAINEWIHNPERHDWIPRISNRERAGRFFIYQIR
ncbi:hypothetical protein EH220_05945 [bacterium]|nr:MAG: hypothetical protein EH220_05945 [bacterium]